MLVRSDVVGIPSRLTLGDQAAGILSKYAPKPMATSPSAAHWIPKASLPKASRTFVSLSQALARASRSFEMSTRSLSPSGLDPN